MHKYVSRIKTEPKKKDYSASYNSKIIPLVTDKINNNLFGHKLKYSGFPDRNILKITS